MSSRTMYDSLQKTWRPKIKTSTSSRSSRLNKVEDQSVWGVQWFMQGGKDQEGVNKTRKDKYLMFCTINVTQNE